MLPLPSRFSLSFCFLMIRCDMRAYGKHCWRRKGCHISTRYRLIRAWRTGDTTCRILLTPAVILAKFFLAPTYDTELPWRADCGPGLYLPHPQGVIVAGDARLGVRVTLFQQVTLGGWNDGSPRLKSRVAVFAGAKIFGKVTIGRRSFVGANAVVARSVPPWHTAVGVPAVSQPRTDAEAQRFGRGQSERARS